MLNPSHALETSADDTALQEAAFWFVSLNDDLVSEAERQAWQEWLACSEANQRAWQKIEQVDRQFHKVPAQQGFQVLQHEGVSRKGVSRRQFALGLGALAVTVPWLWRERDTLLSPMFVPGEHLATSRGEMREFPLSDGSRLWLNTDSRVEVDFNAQHRILRLRRGEIALTTGKDPRPLKVMTDMGDVTPLGTVFNVRYEEDAATTYVSVSKGKVAVKPKRAEDSITLSTQQSIQFDTASHSKVGRLSLNDQAWQQGFLVADNMPLGEFVKQLGRYHTSGWLCCSEEAQSLRLIGRYSLKDTVRILDTLEHSLPIHIRQVTPWFTYIELIK